MRSRTTVFLTHSCQLWQSPQKSRKLFRKLLWHEGYTEMYTKCFVLPSLHSTQSIQCQPGSSFGDAMVRMRSKPKESLMMKALTIETDLPVNFLQPVRDKTPPPNIQHFHSLPSFFGSDAGIRWVTSQDTARSIRGNKNIRSCIIITRRTLSRALIVRNCIYTTGSKV